MYKILICTNSFSVLLRLFERIREALDPFPVALESLIKIISEQRRLLDYLNELHEYITQ